MKGIGYLLMLIPIYLCIAFFFTTPMPAYCYGADCKIDPLPQSMLLDWIISLWPILAIVIAGFFLVTALRMRVDHWIYNRMPNTPRAIGYEAFGKTGNGYVDVQCKEASDVNKAIGGISGDTITSVSNIGLSTWRLHVETNGKWWIMKDIYKTLGGK